MKFSVLLEKTHRQYRNVRGIKKIVNILSQIDAYGGRHGNKEFVIVVDFGGQYNQLIARRVRENHVYCEVYPYNKALDKIKELKPQGIIFTGGPNSVYEENSPKIEKEIFELGIPVLGMCYGMQFMAHTLGGEVKSADNREFG